jgi:hypothetical protein
LGIFFFMSQGNVSMFQLCFRVARVMQRGKHSIIMLMPPKKNLLISASLIYRHKP